MNDKKRFTSYRVKHLPSTRCPQQLSLIHLSRTHSFKNAWFAFIPICNLALMFFWPTKAIFVAHVPNTSDLPNFVLTLDLCALTSSTKRVSSRSNHLNFEGFLWASWIVTPSAFDLAFQCLSSRAGGESLSCLSLAGRLVCWSCWICRGDQYRIRWSDIWNLPLAGLKDHKLLKIVVII